MRRICWLATAKKWARFPTSHAFAAGQPQVSLMNQGRCLQNVIRRLAFHLAGRNTVKLRIDQAGGMFGGITVAMLHSVQQ
jgi:hypothetical protein